MATPSENAAAAPSQTSAGRVNHRHLLREPRRRGIRDRRCAAPHAVAAERLPVASGLDMERGEARGQHARAAVGDADLELVLAGASSRARSIARGSFGSVGRGSSATGRASSSTTATPVVRSASGACAGTASTAKRVR
jgi:hypothetical protein